MAYLNSNPVARKCFTFARFFVCFYLNVKKILATGFEFWYAVTALYFSWVKTFFRSWDFISHNWGDKTEHINFECVQNILNVFKIFWMCSKSFVCIQNILNAHKFVLYKHSDKLGIKSVSILKFRKKTMDVFMKFSSTYFIFVV